MIFNDRTEIVQQLIYVEAYVEDGANRSLSSRSPRQKT